MIEARIRREGEWWYAEVRDTAATYQQWAKLNRINDTYDFHRTRRSARKALALYAKGGPTVSRVGYAEYFVVEDGKVRPKADQDYALDALAGKNDGE